MSDYRCYLSDDCGRFLGIDAFDAPSDAAAIDEARRLLARRHPGKPFELWHGARQVSIEPWAARG